MALTVEDIQKCLPDGDLDQFVVSRPDLSPISLTHRFVVCYDSDVNQLVNFRVINMENILGHINNCPDCQKWLACVNRSRIAAKDTKKRAEIERAYSVGGGGIGR